MERADEFCCHLRRTRPERGELIVPGRHTCSGGGREEACPDRAILLARDEAGELERAVDLLHHDAKNGMEFMIARQGEEKKPPALQVLKLS